MEKVDSEAYGSSQDVKQGSIDISGQAKFSIDMYKWRERDK